MHLREYWQEDFVTIVCALAHIKSCTAQGSDEIPAFILGTLCQDSKEQLAEIFTDILTGKEALSWDLKQGEGCPYAREEKESAFSPELQAFDRY